MLYRFPSHRSAHRLQSSILICTPVNGNTGTSRIRTITAMCSSKRRRRSRLWIKMHQSVLNYLPWILSSQSRYAGLNINSTFFVLQWYGFTPRRPPWWDSLPNTTLSQDRCGGRSTSEENRSSMSWWLWILLEIGITYICNSVWKCSESIVLMYIWSLYKDELLTMPEKKVTKIWKNGKKMFDFFCSKSKYLRSDNDIYGW